MGVHGLEALFDPRRVAVVGAGDGPQNVGGAVLRNLIAGGFPGRLDPVNPRHATVAGLPAAPAVGDLSDPPDLAIVCTPAATVPGILRQCGTAGVRAAAVLSAGFGEAGDAGRALDVELRAVRTSFPELRILGPNSVGFVVPGRSLNATFGLGMPPTGRVAMLSQSGALCTALLDRAVEERLGFSHFVSVGNLLDVGFGDLIDYLGQRPETEAIVLYVESVPDARAFLSAARGFSRTKPIVAYKAGRFPESARAAASHTGALAGEDAVLDAAFRRVGVVRVSELEDLFATAELLCRGRIPAGEGLAVLTNGGGFGVLAADALLGAGGRLARLTPATTDALHALLPAHASAGNPVDLLGDAPPERFARALDVLLADPGVSAVVVVLAPQAMTDPRAAAREVATAAERTRRPVLACWMGGPGVRDGVRLLETAGIPTFESPERAVRAFLSLVAHRRSVAWAAEMTRDVRVFPPPDRARARRLVEDELRGGPATLDEVQSKALLRAYGIPTVATVVARSAAEAAELGRELGFPVVVKVLGPGVSHKTDVGGVVLDVASADDAARAFERVTAALRERGFAGTPAVTVQPQVRETNAVELLVGAVRDPVFGPALLAGVGGTTAEIFADRTLELPPLDERLARRMLTALRIRPLLEGHRGSPPVDLAAAVDVLLRLSAMVADLPELAELDVNPLLVSPRGAVALDARVVLAPAPEAAAGRPWAHLAIRPPPSGPVRSERLRDGTAVTIRPIRAEDESAVLEMLGRCSADSLWGRFGFAVRPSPALAVRFCSLDYDREMAFGAEVDGLEPRTLAGIGGLSADPDHEVAELAVLVADPWQGRGLGELLVDGCIAAAPTWGVRALLARAHPNDGRMLHILESRGFDLQRKPEATAVTAIRRAAGSAAVSSVEGRL